MTYLGRLLHNRLYDRILVSGGNHLIGINTPLGTWGLIVRKVGDRLQKLLARFK